MDTEKESKYLECASCIHIFDCKIDKADKPDNCLNYEERGKSNG